MTHQLLLYAYRSAGFVQERAVRMPECVPPKPLDANSFSLGFENVPLNDASVEATPGDGRREDEPLRAVPPST